ncbi:MAG: heme peroxidase family protein [Parvibaculum sp.]
MVHGADTFNRGLELPQGRFQRVGKFGRKFPNLRSLKSFSFDDAEEVGKSQGIMEGAGADNPRIVAGFTFLGQFIDHDITFDPTSHLERQNDPEAVRNFRTPALELDSVYGAGPEAQPFLYDSRRHGHLLLNQDGEHDLPRNHQGVALIGDPRNDENLIVSQIHLTFLKFHNAVLERHSSGFEEAQTLVRWHYQWIVLNEFLRLTCGDEAVDAALARPDTFDFGDEVFMPVEFAVAAYRFGHSQVRAGYSLNDQKSAALFPADATQSGPSHPGERTDLRGGSPVAPEFAINWSKFFGGNEGVQPSKLIDTKLAAPLLNLPGSVVPDSSLPNKAPNRSLAVRNLKRGISFSLPSGEDVAGFYKIAPLTPEERGDLPGGEDGTPLWFYVLKEAEVRARGQHLAGVGARIVAEVVVDLLRADAASFLASSPDWKPTLPSSAKGDFRMTDLIDIAVS